MPEREERVESPGAYVTEYVSCDNFCLAPCSSDHPTVLWRYNLEMGGKLLHDAVWVNCKKCVTTQNQGAGVKYMDKH